MPVNKTDDIPNPFAKKQKAPPSIDDQPVGAHARKNSNKYGEIAQFGGRMSEGSEMQEMRPKQEEVVKKISPPRKKIVENSPPGTHEEEVKVEAPTYDFERMIEEAMKKAGESGGKGGGPKKNANKK